MNRGMLVLVGLVSSIAIATVGCGDDTGSGGSGGGDGGSDTGGGGGDGGNPTTGGGGSGAGDEGGGGGTPAAATCESYCALIDSTCLDSNKQYTDAGACELECAAFEQGTPGATSGDNLECRMYHATAATAGDENLHCVHAGPLGSGTTAGPGCTADDTDERCAAYCAIADEICAGDANYPFDSEDDCVTECSTLNGGFVDDADFNMGRTSGDTLACRMYHLSVAVDSPDPHCGHIGAGATDDGVCDPVNQ